MARKVRIATMSGEVLSFPYEQGLDNAVENIISYWGKKLSMVWSDEPDLVVLPECCDRYLNLTIEQRMEYYEVRGSRVLDYFAGEAKKHNCYIAYSAIFPGDDGINRNSVIMIDRKGEVIGRYDKVFPVVGECEANNGLPGNEAVVFECDFGRVGAAICFDLNFDSLREMYKEKKPELMIFSSAYHGGLMQNYWAYDLRCWFVSAVGCGNPSTVVNPIGVKVAETSNYSTWLTKEINLDYFVGHLDFNIEKAYAAKEKYKTGFDIFDPGYIGSFLLSSEMDDVTALEIAEEFDFETLDGYFERNIKYAEERRKKE